MKKKITVKDKVLALLSANPWLASDVTSLQAIYYRKFHNWDMNTRCGDFFNAIRAKKLPKPHSINRAKRELLQEKPHLRDSEYIVRKREEARIRKEYSQKKQMEMFN